MAQTTLLPKRLQTIRKQLRRSIRDCAGILNISSEEYLAFEEGNHALSLPELELLAQYFGTTPEKLFNETSPDQNGWALLDDDIRPRYLTLRNKMIRAQLLQKRQSVSISLDDLHDLTQIPKAALDFYDMGTQPIPLGDLDKISAALGMARDDFLTSQEKTKNSKTDHEDRWHQEFPDDSEGEQTQYQEILAALRSLPEDRQAHIAKIILNELKAQ